MNYVVDQVTKINDGFYAEVPEFWLVRVAVATPGRCHEVGLELNGDPKLKVPLVKKKRIWLAS